MYFPTELGLTPSESCFSTTLGFFLFFFKEIHNHPSIFSTSLCKSPVFLKVETHFNETVIQFSASRNHTHLPIGKRQKAMNFQTVIQIYEILFENLYSFKFLCLLQLLWNQVLYHCTDQALSWGDEYNHHHHNLFLSNTF